MVPWGLKMISDSEPLLNYPFNQFVCSSSKQTYSKTCHRLPPPIRNRPCHCGHRKYQYHTSRTSRHPRSSRRWCNPNSSAANSTRCYPRRLVRSRRWHSRRRFGRVCGAWRLCSRGTRTGTWSRPLLRPCSSRSRKCCWVCRWRPVGLRRTCSGRTWGCMEGWCDKEGTQFPHSVLGGEKYWYWNWNWNYFIPLYIPQIMRKKITWLIINNNIYLRRVLLKIKAKLTSKL